MAFTLEEILEAEEASTPKVGTGFSLEDIQKAEEAPTFEAKGFDIADIENAESVPGIAPETSGLGTSFRRRRRATGPADPKGEISKVGRFVEDFVLGIGEGISGVAFHERITGEKEKNLAAIIGEGIGIAVPLGVFGKLKLASNMLKLERAGKFTKRAAKLALRSLGMGTFGSTREAVNQLTSDVKEFSPAEIAKAGAEWAAFEAVLGGVVELGVLGKSIIKTGRARKSTAESLRKAPTQDVKETLILRAEGSMDKTQFSKLLDENEEFVELLAKAKRGSAQRKRRTGEKLTPAEEEIIESGLKILPEPTGFPVVFRRQQTKTNRLVEKINRGEDLTEGETREAFSVLRTQSGRLVPELQRGRRVIGEGKVFKSFEDFKEGVIEQRLREIKPIKEDLFAMIPAGAEREKILRIHSIGNEEAKRTAKQSLKEVPRKKKGDISDEANRAKESLSKDLTPNQITQQTEKIAKDLKTPGTVTGAKVEPSSFKNSVDEFGKIASDKGAVPLSFIRRVLQTPESRAFTRGDQRMINLLAAGNDLSDNGKKRLAEFGAQAVQPLRKLYRTGNFNASEIKVAKALDTGDLAGLNTIEKEVHGELKSFFDKMADYIGLEPQFRKKDYLPHLWDKIYQDKGLATEWIKREGLVPKGHVFGNMKARLKNKEGFKLNLTEILNEYITGSISYVEKNKFIQQARSIILPMKDKNLRRDAARYVMFAMSPRQKAVFGEETTRFIRPLFALQQSYNFLTKVGGKIAFYPRDRLQVLTHTAPDAGVANTIKGIVDAKVNRKTISDIYEKIGVDSPHFASEALGKIENLTTQMRRATNMTKRAKDFMVDKVIPIAIKLSDRNNRMDTLASYMRKEAKDAGVPIKEIWEKIVVDKNLRARVKNDINRAQINYRNIGQGEIFHYDMGSWALQFQRYRFGTFSLWNDWYREGVANTKTRGFFLKTLARMGINKKTVESGAVYAAVLAAEAYTGYNLFQRINPLPAIRARGADLQEQLISSTLGPNVSQALNFSLGLAWIITNTLKGNPGLDTTLENGPRSAFDVQGERAFNATKRDLLNINVMGMWRDLVDEDALHLFFGIRPNKRNELSKGAQVELQRALEAAR